MKLLPFFLLALFYSLPVSAAQRPNVILVITDDQLILDQEMVSVTRGHAGALAEGR